MNPSELPICLSDIWDEGAPVLHDNDKRRCILLLALLIRDRDITKEAAKKALTEWAQSEILAESEVSRAYASDERLTCKLLQSIGYVSDRCERDFCEFPAWRGKHNAERLEDLKKEAIKRKFSGQNVHEVSEEIQVNGRYLQDISADVLRALEAHNVPPQIFVRSGHLARIAAKDRLVIEPLSESALRGSMARSAGFVTLDGIDKNGNPKHTKARPPLDVTRDILGLADWPGFPAIEAVIETPALRPDGSILIEPGYDKPTRLYFAPGSDLKDLQVPEAPSADNAKKAAEHVLSEIFSDFPFKDEASKANALALLLSVIIRPMIDGNVPLALLDKPQAGTGASFLAEVVAMIATGRPANMGCTRNRRRMEKVHNQHPDRRQPGYRH